MPLSPELQAHVDTIQFKNEAAKAAYIRYLETPEEAEKEFMMNSDYTHKTQSLADERRAFEKQQADWNQGQNYVTQQNQTWRDDVTKRLNDSLDQVSKSRLYGAALESKLQSLAADYGLDFEDLMKDVKDKRAAEPEKPAAPDYTQTDERYVSRDDVKKGFDTMFAYSPMLRDLEWEYKKLYGKDYDGSITELMKDASTEVQARQQRGVQSDLWSVMREKLDFSGQTQRNAEAKVAADKQERADWEKKTREEIDRDLRTQYNVTNPGAARKPDKSNEWRQNLSAAKRQQNRQPDRKQTPMDDFQRRQQIHRAYEERAAKTEAVA